MQVEEATCDGFRNQVANITAVVTEFEANWGYYHQQLENVKKEYEETQKTMVTVISGSSTKETVKKEASEEKVETTEKTTKTETRRRYKRTTNKKVTRFEQ